MITYEKVQQLANTAVKLLFRVYLIKVTSQPCTKKKLLHNHVNICHGNQDASKKSGTKRHYFFLSSLVDIIHLGVSDQSKKMSGVRV